MNSYSVTVSPLIVISISIVALLDDDDLIAIPVVAVSNQVTIAILVARPDGYTNADLFCSGRHCAANASHDSNYDC